MIEGIISGMDNDRLTKLLDLGQGRVRQLGCSYSGALTPVEAYEILQLSSQAKLVDVRTRAELVWVGRIPGAIEIEWMGYPACQPNPDFIEQLKHLLDPGLIVMMLCRSGVRSHKAAELAFESGFLSCYNVLEGFEGDFDPVTGQRGGLNGWRHAGLPWKS